MSNAERPILVGGTGRSGSTIVGHLLDHHPDLTLTRPMEVRFITGNDGIADALAVAMRKPGSAKAEAAPAACTVTDVVSGSRETGLRCEREDDMVVREGSCFSESVDI